MYKTFINITSYNQAKKKTFKTLILCVCAQCELQYLKYLDIIENVLNYIYKKN